MNAFVRHLLGWTLLASLAASLALAQTMPASRAYYFGTWVGASSLGTADGAGSAARFSYPFGLTADAAGNLFVADTFNHTIRKIAPSGVVTTLAGSPGENGLVDASGSAARFNLPQAIAYHSDGNLYVGEAGGLRRVSRDGAVTRLVDKTWFDSNIVSVLSEPEGTLLVADLLRVARVTTSGEMSTLFPSWDIHVNGGIAALVRDAGRNLYVAMNVVLAPDGVAREQARIYRALPGGGFAVFADENNGLAGVRRLNALAADSQGALFATANNHTVLRVTASGATVFAGTPDIAGARDGAAEQALFDDPHGLVFDATGNLYVSEYNNTIRRITPAGVVSTVAGIPEEESARHWDARGTAARFSHPAAIAINANGVAYVADEFNHVIRQINPDGTVTTLAGSPGEAGYVDGIGAAARFNFPRDLAIDPAGTIYVIENSGAVRKITPAGSVSTLAGGAARDSPSAQDGQGAQATFGSLSAIAAWSTGDVYVAESAGNSPTQGSVWARVRKITSTGIVTTIPVPTVFPHSYFSGMAFDRTGVLHLADPEYMRVHRLRPDGTADSLRFDDFAPRRIAIDASGNSFFADDGQFGASRVARYAAAGPLEIVGGSRYLFGHHDAIGTRARFTGLTGIAVDAAGALYLTDEDNTMRKAVAVAAPTIATQPANQTVASGSAVTFSVGAAAVPEPTYQWFFNGAAIAGATSASHTIGAAGSTHAGNYHVVVTNEVGSAPSATATLTVRAPFDGDSSGGSSGGGGGAPSDVFLAACAALALARGVQRRRASARGE